MTVTSIHGVLNGTVLTLFQVSNGQLPHARSGREEVEVYLMKSDHTNHLRTRPGALRGIQRMFTRSTSTVLGVRAPSTTSMVKRPNSYTLLAE